jgi:hypothetical protein
MRLAAAALALVVSVQAIRFGPPGGPRPTGAGGDGSRRRSGAAVLGALVVGAPTAASARKTSNKVTFSDKLRNVPAFFVANSRGSPYLINKESEGAQECVIFLEPGDAEQLLKEMVQASPMLADARVMCVGLDRALAMLARPAAPTGNVHKGRQLMLRYRLQPAQRQLRAARSKLAVKAKAPCFTCSGLKDAKGRTPVFLDLADLELAWTKVAGEAKPNVQVHDLLDLAALSKRPDAGDAFDDLVMYPMSGTVEYVAKNRRRGNGVARLHGAIGA